jgi:hypothetical protein
MDLSALAAVSDLVAGAWTLAKEMGKGGGGSTEEPTVCITLLPVALGVAYVGLRQLRRVILAGPGGRTAAPVPNPERKVQTA